MGISLTKIMKFALIALVATATAIRRDAGPAYQPGQSGKLGGGVYDRATPARFSADNDDIFMRSVIQNYAQEGSWKDGEPTGVFTLTESSARALAMRSLLPTKTSAVELKLSISVPTGPKHGDISMLTEPVPSQSSMLHNS